MSCIEIAFERGWHNIWLESDSTIVVHAFKNESLVPWHLKTRWHNCLVLTTRMRFIVSHIFREGNTCADGLTSYGTSNHSFNWWDLVPSFIRDEFKRNTFFSLVTDSVDVYMGFSLVPPFLVFVFFFLFLIIILGCCK